MAKTDATIKGEGDSLDARSTGTLQTYPSHSAGLTGEYPFPFWGDLSEISKEPKWLDGDYWLNLESNQSVTSFYHRLVCEFPAGSPVVLRGFTLGSSDSGRNVKK